MSPRVQTSGKGDITPFRVYYSCMLPASPTIIFDSNCVLCSRLVAFVLANERAPEFKFVGAWSDSGLSLAARHGFSRDDLDKTFLVIIGAKAYSQSDAGVEILKRMRPPWSWLAALKFVPRFLRDPVYSAIATRRYRWFGRKVDCPVVPFDQRHRFPTLSGSKPLEP